ncbi:hypothetical protein BDB01DRAFT_847128 [Pilobolus umbonatus]|nr:hypothetical protein BDB01DRAFT_847128 [Pilobolus umbonatus]
MEIINMQAEPFPSQNQPMPHPYFNRGVFRRRDNLCGKLPILYGGPLVCMIWIAINLYVCILSFQKKSPIYSHLDNSLYVIQGLVCLWFLISALFSLYFFCTDVIRLLRRSDQMTWTIVTVFLITYFIIMVIFGVKKRSFITWCISKSRDRLNETVTTTLPDGTVFVLSFIPGSSDTDLYNCSRVWVNEIKLSVIVFIILLVTYVHSAICFYYFTRSRIEADREVLQTKLRPLNMNPMPTMVNDSNNIMNIPPSHQGLNRSPEEEGGRSMAQITRDFLSRLRR